MLDRARLAAIGVLAIWNSLGAAVCDTPPSDDTEGNKGPWKFSLETLTYLEQHARDYGNPNFSADYDKWLHLEARYNYEALKTGSVWVGRKFSDLKIAEGLKVDATPMLGGIFGDITGVAPGYYIEVSYEEDVITASSQGLYFFDAGNSSGNFFYSWSELSASLPKFNCIRAGLVIESTQDSVRPGPLLGLKRKIIGKDVELTTYWLAPGSTEAAFVFGVNVDFK